MNPRFEPGQKVAIHGLQQNPFYNGAVVRIMHREYVENEPSTELGTYTGWIYRVDPLFRWISEPFLRPLNKKGSWDTCIWQPEQTCES